MRALREQGYTEPSLSLVATIGSESVGHVLFSTLSILHDAGTVEALALAPVAVVPDHQNHGIGSKLIQAGIDQARMSGYPAIVVLGNPGYYGRFGFSLEVAGHLRSPYAGPHFMALELAPGILSSLKNARAHYLPQFSEV